MFHEQKRILKQFRLWREQLPFGISNIVIGHWNITSWSRDPQQLVW